MPQAQLLAENPQPSTTLDAESIPLANGQHLCIWRWPQQKGRPLLHWAHATGFHGRMYRPLLDRLSTQFNVIAWDMRGHGESYAPDVSQFTGWTQYYDDLCCLIDHYQQPLFLGGHSVGGTASAIAAARRPDQILGLVLADPVLLDPWSGMKLALMKWTGQSHKFALAGAAARRRAVFTSRDEVVERYRGRGAFKSWSDEWLNAYVAHAFKDTAKGIELCCQPAWESASFAHTEHNPWSKLRGLRAPTIALAGETGSWLSPQSARWLSRINPQTRTDTVPGTSHFLPMEAPEAVIEAVDSLIHATR